MTLSRIGTLGLHTRYLGALILLLVLAAPAAAEKPDHRAWGPALAVLNGAGVEVVLFGSTPAKGASIEGPSAQGSCTATCCNGTSFLTCTGSYCEAQDADCSVGIRGYCSGTDTGTKYCPDCSWQMCTDCSEEPACEVKHGTPCSTPWEEADCSFPDRSCGDCICDDTTWMCTL